MDTVRTPKHTPGPWHVEHIPGIDQGATAEITAPCGTGTPFDGRSIIIAQVWKTNDEIPRWSDDETAQANARLMAAAPALLAQCRAALRYLQHPDVKAVTHGFALSGAVIERRIEAAISEAEGGQS